MDTKRRWIDTEEYSNGLQVCKSMFLGCDLMLLLIRIDMEAHDLAR